MRGKANLPMATLARWTSPGHWAFGGLALFYPKAEKHELCDNSILFFLPSPLGRATPQSLHVVREGPLCSVKHPPLQLIQRPTRPRRLPLVPRWDGRHPHSPVFYQLLAGRPCPHLVGMPLCWVRTREIFLFALLQFLLARFIHSTWRAYLPTDVR